MNEVYEFLRQCGTFYIATCEGDQPRVRPFGAVDLFEGRLYLQTGKVKKVYQQMIANPKIELCGMAEGRWIRVSALVAEDTRLDAAQHMLDANPVLKKMYAAGDGNNTVFYLHDVTAVIASFTEAPKTIQF